MPAAVVSQHTISADCSTCSVCGRQRAPTDQHALVPCHVRAFRGQQFQLWRCACCNTLHCAERVDLPSYYAKYPFARAKLTRPFRIFYRNLLSRLTRHGFNPDRSLLDYGCGQGLFLRYLARAGFRRAVGYDPYADPAGWGNAAVLKQAPFDFILLQDVLEHVEEPQRLLAQLDSYLAPNGLLVVGTPNAERIRLDRAPRFLNELHAPYHLHIYGRQTVEAWGLALGLQAVDFWDRAYHDTLWPGLNTRAGKAYQSLVDGTLDAALERIDVRRAMASPRFWWWSLAGYWLSQRADMTVVFRKPAPSSSRVAA